ncbi:MAG: NifB/NifX family molybdenum-iron cluster-binding protein [Calditrichaeota bacterium]|nr:NifB/NifX family molybdenum-iron cluster-binding protein [Calditrichota bacterium]MCB9086754.1 NifB/NifX family molybdenum-iron cluster-binding protein [Calditrichia bacterium]
MKIAISASENQLAASIELNFEKAPYYILIDLDRPVEAGYKVVHNPNVQSMNNAGILAAQMLINLGIDVLITGWCDPNALRVFQKAKIPIYQATAGTVEAMVAMFKAKNYTLEDLLNMSESGSSKLP